MSMRISLVVPRVIEYSKDYAGRRGKINVAKTELTSLLKKIIQALVHIRNILKKY